MITWFSIPWLVLAQVAPASAPSDAELEAAFGASLAQDRTATQPPPPSPAPVSSAAFLNPEISLIGSFAATARLDGDVAPLFQAGDDPPVEGVGVQELELAFAADVDPYFKMRAFLTIPGSGDLEIEEAFLETTALPRGLGLKAGSFRSSFGRNNEQHLHVQDFARRPKMTTLLGEDGLRAPGGQLSYLIPTPWYASLFVEYLAVSSKPSGTAVLEQFFDLSPTWSLLWGLQAGTLQRDAPDDMVAAPDREYLIGTDVYIKWKPLNQVDTYWWVALTAEYLAGRTETRDWDGAGYAQLVMQVARRWRVGARADWVGFPQTTLTREVDVSGSLAFLPSEFSRLRITYAHDHPFDHGQKSNDYFIFQLEGTIGAHGAHPF